MVVNQLLKYGEFGIVLFDNFQVTERTRNQFVDNTTRGFESLPLRQKTRTLLVGVLVFCAMGGDEPISLCDKRFAYRRHRVNLEAQSIRGICVVRRTYLASIISGTIIADFPRTAYPSHTLLVGVLVFCAMGEDSHPAP